MIIVNTTDGEYNDVINSYYDLERYDDGIEDVVLFQGYATVQDDERKKKYRHIPRKIYLNLESPCSFFSNGYPIDDMCWFDEVYIICPYTANWLNGMSTGKTKFFPIPFPYNEDCFKDLDVFTKDTPSMYMGTMLSDTHIGVAQVVRSSGGRVFSLSSDRCVTDVKKTSKEKWEMLAKSRTSVAMNCMPIDVRQVDIATSFYNWYNNIALKHVYKQVTYQFKPRIIEAARCRAINLVYKDGVDVIEKWFVPGEDFIYWTSLQELSDLIHDVNDNWKKFEHIADSAYGRVQNYEVHKWFRRIT